MNAYSLGEGASGLAYPARLFRPLPPVRLLSVLRCPGFSAFGTVQHRCVDSLFSYLWLSLQFGQVDVNVPPLVL